MLTVLVVSITMSVNT